MLVYTIPHHISDIIFLTLLLFHFFIYINQQARIHKQNGADYYDSVRFTITVF